jgi:O-antigen/teichoic acid export membrane protein
LDLRSLLRRDLVRVAAASYILSALTLCANLAAGIANARALAPSGRGEAVAIAMLAQNFAFVFAFGCVQAVSYRYAREPAVGARLATTWAMLLVPLALVAVAVGEIVLPVLFSAQSSGAVDLARVYLLTIGLVLCSELTNGLLLGQGAYRYVQVVRFAQPALAAASQVLLWQLGELTVETSLATAAGSTLLVQVFAIRRALRGSGGLGRFDRRLARETLWYGFRGHGALIGTALNQRLDLLILPAFIVSAGVGLYSIAANVSLIVSTLANSIAGIALPAAVRRGERGPSTVVAFLQAALVIALVLAGSVFVVAEPALTLVYGHAFGAAAPSLRVLLPGTVLLAGASILAAGLYAANRPGTATVAQLAGLCVTVVGLLVVLPGAGIMGAAWVSTASYATVFVCSLLAYKRSARLPWRRFLARPGAPVVAEPPEPPEPRPVEQAVP